MKLEFDLTKIVEEIAMQVEETQEEFIFETVHPYCENVLQMKINKEELKQILLKGAQKTNWVPCSERLPEEDGLYLISTCMNCIDTCLFYKDDDEYVWVDYEESVIAWMPLPEPYKAESEEKE